MRILMISFICLFAIGVRANSDLEACAHAESLKALQIVKDTVGLRQPEIQLPAIVELATLICTKFENLNATTEEETKQSIQNGFDRAYNEVFNSEEI